MTKKNRDAGTERKSQRNRRALFDVLHSIAKKADDARKQYSRQIDYDDAFSSLMTEGAIGGIRLVPPPYLPGKMYELYEQSGILKTCVEAYVDNVDGYGYSIASTIAEDDNVQKDNNPGVLTLREFFDCPNDKESLTTIRNKVRRDFEVTGNGYIEVVRGRDNKPVLLFWADAKRMRITTSREPVLCTVQVPRGGSLIDVQAEKRFRTYCMLSGDGSASGPRARFFKEYGDPRELDALTGQFASKGASIQEGRLASEIIHFRHGNDIYGSRVG